MNLFEGVADLASSGYLFRIQDNGGATADRYTAVFCDGDYLGMSSSPTHPQGVSQWGEDPSLQRMAEEQEAGTEVDLAVGDLPPHIALHVLSRVNEAWRDFLEGAENGDPKRVAAVRDDAEEYEGLHSQAGTGIYATPEGFRVCGDGAPEDDNGPYATVRTALRMTLPEDCSLSGPEYHSTLDVSRTDPSPGVAAAVAALEAKVEAAWKAANPRSSFGC